MKGLVLVRSIAANWAREPWKWALFALLLALWPAIQVLAPFGATPTQASAHALVYEIAFVSASTGVACALDALEVMPSCAYALGFRFGWPAEWGAMMVGGMAVQLGALAIPLIAMRAVDLSFVVALTARLCFSAAYMASAGLILLRLRIPVGLRALALLAVTWILPALAPWTFVANLPGSASNQGIDDTSTPHLLASRIASIIALLLGAHLMDAQRRQHL